MKRGRCLFLLAAVGLSHAFALVPAGGALASLQRRRSAPLLMMAKPSTFNSFDDMLAGFDEPVLVDFYATWCGPCQMMSPILEDLGKELVGKLRVAKVDTEKYPQIGTRFAVEGLPTVVLFKGGEEVHRMMGYFNKEQLLEGIGPFL